MSVCDRQRSDTTQPHLLPAVISDFFNSAVLSIYQTDEDADLFTHTEILHSNYLKKKDNIFYSRLLAVSLCYLPTEHSVKGQP